MSNGHVSAMFMGLMHWRLIKRPLTSKCISNKAVLCADQYRLLTLYSIFWDRAYMNESIL